MNKNKKWVASGTVVLALVVGIGWAMGFFENQDPQLAELEEMRDKAFENNKEFDEEKFRGQREQFREKIGQLSDEQREQFFKNSRPMFQQMINQRMNKFFAMSEEEQNAELDKLIDRMENRSRDGNTGGRGWRGGGEMSQQQRDQRRQKRLDSTTPEMRAKFDKFKDMLNDRREQRGLPPSDGFGRWR